MSQGKSAAHTPGPWKAVHYPDGDYGIFSEHGGPLATTRRDSQIDEANARLIAASPTMLEALELIRMSLGWQYLSEESRVVLVAAIKLARGEFQ